jgi:hypothetical protein
MKWLRTHCSDSLPSESCQRTMLSSLHHLQPCACDNLTKINACHSCPQQAGDKHSGSASCVKCPMFCFKSTCQSVSCAWEEKKSYWTMWCICRTGNTVRRYGATSPGSCGILPVQGQTLDCPKHILCLFITYSMGNNQRLNWNMFSSLFLDGEWRTYSLWATIVNTWDNKFLHLWVYICLLFSRQNQGEELTKIWQFSKKAQLLLSTFVPTFLAIQSRSSYIKNILLLMSYFTPCLFYCSLSNVCHVQ